MLLGLVGIMIVVFKHFTKLEHLLFRGQRGDVVEDIVVWNIKDL